MEDLQTISALIPEAASNIGYDSVKSKQIQAVLEFCKGKDIFASLPTGYGKTLIFAVFPLLFIQQACFAYAASVKVLHPAAQPRDTRASAMSHLAISSLIRLFFVFFGKQLPV